jgi:hypothetical protein
MAHWFGSDPAALNFHVNFLLEHVFHYFFLFLRKKEEKTWTTKLKTDDAYIITGSFRRPFCGEYVLFKLYGVARKDERNCFFFPPQKRERNCIFRVLALQRWLQVVTAPGQALP